MRESHRDHREILTVAGVRDGERAGRGEACRDASASVLGFRYSLERNKVLHVVSPALLSDDLIGEDNILSRALHARTHNI